MTCTLFYGMLVSRQLMHNSNAFPLFFCHLQPLPALATYSLHTVGSHCHLSAMMLLVPRAAGAWRLLCSTLPFVERNNRNHQTFGGLVCWQGDVGLYFEILDMDCFSQTRVDRSPRRQVVRSSVGTGVICRLLLSVSDTLPWWGRGVEGGCLGQRPFSVVFGSHGPPPAGGGVGVGVGFSWVLGVRALGPRGR